MQVNCYAGVLLLRLEFIDKHLRSIFTEPDIVTTSSPLPVTISFRLFVCFHALTSGDFVLPALKRDFVCDGRGADGV